MTNYDLMEGKGEQLEALERVCLKRYMRGASCDDVIKFLSGYRKKWNQSVHITKGADILIGYWNSRKG